MAAFLLLAVLFVFLAVAGLAGGCADSRDSRSARGRCIAATQRPSPA